MRILVVEDEKGVAKFIKQGLSEAGYAVDTAGDGEEGSDYIAVMEYDIILLDIMLPRIGGIELLQSIRKKNIKVPVILLTARDGLTDRVAGLDAGADDYLVKPFAFPELLARIRALLRRPPIQNSTVLKVHDLEMDVSRHEVKRGGVLIDLSPREFALLEFLMRNNKQTLTRTQLIEHVWNYDFYTGTNVLDVYIGYLRKKINTGNLKPLIRTVRGIGYKIDDA
ncbi:MAG: response regulator transcription factor [Spirochaetes bacterium]|nr:response regulator transcription factor [Spirochaetota bacterium]